MGAGNSSDMAAPVIINPTAKHTATVIFLHGLGDTGHGWADLMKKVASPHIKYICPTAPTQPVSLNMNMKMPSWFDIKGLHPDAPEDVHGIKKSSEYILKLVEEETQKHSIPTSRMLLGGFSQGGALSLYTALASKKSFAGLILLSCWLPLHKQFKDQVNVPDFKNTPVLQCHGEQDPLVPYQWGKKTSDLVKQLTNAEYQFLSYSTMGHSSCDQEISDIKTFIAKYLPQS